MSHAPSRADRLLIKPAAGARPAPPCHPDGSFPRHATRPVTRRVTSSTETPGWRRPQTDRPNESHSHQKPQGSVVTAAVGKVRTPRPPCTRFPRADPDIKQQRSLARGGASREDNSNEKRAACLGSARSWRLDKKGFHASRRSAGPHGEMEIDTYPFRILSFNAVRLPRHPRIRGKVNGACPDDPFFTKYLGEARYLGDKSLSSPVTAAVPR